MLSCPPRFPPYFQMEDRERRARMWEKCADPGARWRKRFNRSGCRFSAPPPPPTYIPEGQSLPKWVKESKSGLLIPRLRSRKSDPAVAKSFSLAFPHSGGLKELEDRDYARARTWDPLLKTTGAPGIYYSDFPELAGFKCPEWSHLTAGDW